MNVYTLTLDNIIILETMDPLSRNLEEEEIMENIIDEDTSQYLNLEGHDDTQVVMEKMKTPMNAI